MDSTSWHYAIVGLDLALFRFITEEERDEYCQAHVGHAFKFLDITQTTGFDEADWAFERDQVTGITYFWTRAWIHAG